MADTATFGGAMKTKMLPTIRDHMPKGKVLLFGDPEANPTEFKGILPKAEGINAVGNEFRITMKTTRNQSVGFRHENELLPAPGSGSYSYITEPLRFAYSLFNITGQLLDASETSEGAFKQAFQAEMEDGVLASKLDMDRAAHGDGSGKLAAVSTGGSATDTHVVLDTTVNFRGLGEVIDFVNAAGTVVSAGHSVTGVVRSTKTITFSPGLADTVTAGTHYPVRASLDSTVSVPNNSQNREIQGLASIVAATGTLHGFNPVTYPWWASLVTPVNGALSEDAIHTAKDNVGFEQGLDVENGLDFALISTRGIRRRYAQTLTSLKQFTNVESTTLRGGYSALMFDDNPFFTDDATPPGVLWGLALNRLFWSQANDWSWMDRDGQVLKWESRRDRYIAILYKYCNLGTTHRGAHFKLTGITDDAR